MNDFSPIPPAYSLLNALNEYLLKTGHDWFVSQSHAHQVIIVWVWYINITQNITTQCVTEHSQAHHEA